MSTGYFINDRCDLAICFLTKKDTHFLFPINLLKRIRSDEWAKQRCMFLENVETLIQKQKNKKEAETEQ